MTLALPAPVAAYFAASNAGDAPKAALAFTLDAVVVDEGRPRRGTAEIAAWVAETRRAYAFTATPTAVAAEGPLTRVTASVAGNFEGSPIELDFLFALADGAIRRLEIR